MSNGTDTSVLDVAIIGAGPVGLFLAGELAGAGIRTTVVEQASAPDSMPKANGVVGHAAVELQRRGVLDGAAVRPVSPSRFPFGPLVLELDRLADNPLHILPIPQRQLEELLERRAVELGAIVFRGHRLLALEQQTNRVQLRLAAASGVHMLPAHYVVGCDGARSTVRRQLGLDFPGFTGDTISRIARITLPAAVCTRADDRVEITGVGSLVLFRPNRTCRGTVTIAPAASFDPSQPDDLYLISTQEPRDDAEAADTLDESELRASLLRVVGAEVPFTAVQWARSTVPNSRQVTHYQVGRVFLAGDAAHVFNAGGSAINVGLLDAAALAAPLADVVHGAVPTAALDDYHRLRQLAGARALRHTRAQAALSQTDPNTDALAALLAEKLQEPALLHSVAETLENG